MPAVVVRFAHAMVMTVFCMQQVLGGSNGGVGWITVGAVGALGTPLSACTALLR